MDGSALGIDHSQPICFVSTQIAARYDDGHHVSATLAATTLAHAPLNLPLAPLRPQPALPASALNPAAAVPRV
eukprot:1090643-Pleurochrysis_carterae.AAC.5